MVAVVPDQTGGSDEKSAGSSILLSESILLCAVAGFPLSTFIVSLIYRAVTLYSVRFVFMSDAWATIWPMRKGAAEISWDSVSVKSVSAGRASSRVYSWGVWSEVDSLTALTWCRVVGASVRPVEKGSGWVTGGRCFDLSMVFEVDDDCEDERTCELP